MARVVKKPGRPAKDPRWQTHVYLSEEEYKKLMEVALRESRSLTMQIQHYVRQGLARSAGGPKSPGE